MGKIDSTIKDIVNPDGIDSTVLVLDNIIDSIVSDLNSIDMIIYNIDDYFTGDVADEFKEKFSSYRAQFELLRQNLGTYTSDLVKVKAGISEVMLKQIRLFDAAALDLKSRAKEKEILN